TGLRPLDPEPSASTSSATSARLMEIFSKNPGSMQPKKFVEPLYSLSQARNAPGNKNHFENKSIPV
ncbi:MAG: hypothetical protein JXK94_11910, partial [Deltaproteobacteria bacterium]|nr:hypothetical protein [Deltaproteobacteria bacterium]